MEAVQVRKSLIEHRVLKLKSTLLTLLIAAYAASLVFPGQIAEKAVSCVTAAAVLVSLPFTGRGTRAVCTALFIAGGYLIYTGGAGWQQWLEAMGKNTSLLALLIVVPLLGVPLKFGGYIEVLDALALKYLVKKYQMYWVPALFSHVLGVFMNLGAVPLTYEITARGKMLDNRELLTKGLSRGFGAAMFWSPNMVATALPLAYLGITWQNYVYLGVLFAVIGLGAGFAVEIPAGEGRSGGRGHYPAVGDASGGSAYIDKLKLAQLTVAAVVFLLMIIAIETRSALPVISAVPFIALVFPALWLLLLGRKKHIKEGYLDYFNNRINHYDGEVVLFVTAGFFSYALSFSGQAEHLCDYVMHFAGHSTGSVVLTILAAIILTSLVGLHPMIMVSTFAASLNPAALGISPVHLALILIGGWSLGATVSPMSGTTLVVAGLTGKRPAEIGRVNILYAIVVSALLTAFIAWA